MLLREETVKRARHCLLVTSPTAPHRVHLLQHLVAVLEPGLRLITMVKVKGKFGANGGTSSVLYIVYF